MIVGLSMDQRYPIRCFWPSARKGLHTYLSPNPGQTGRSSAMSVARCLGVDDFDAPNMREVRAEWPGWQGIESTLVVVDDVKDLPGWMQQAQPADRDSVLAALRRLAEEDGRAFVVLAWLLVPGASLVARRLRRFVDTIDEIVAGQLWIQICDHDPSDDQYVAKKILSRVEREAKAELGVGDLAERRDPAWAATVLVAVSYTHLRAHETDS